MGSPASEEARSENETQHSVTLTTPFYVQTTEVTQGQWFSQMETNPSGFIALGDAHPVERVSWYEALAYANDRSLSEGLPECYTLHGCRGEPGRSMECDGVDVAGDNVYACTGYRLPTEAEWEYAVRAGTDTAYYSGHRVRDLEEIAWVGSNSSDTTEQVGGKVPNAWGLHDMSGNVWEWCWDYYGAYRTGEDTNPVGPREASDRIIRGGSWFLYAGLARSAYRLYRGPNTSDMHTGFRLVRSAI